MYKYKVPISPLIMQDDTMTVSACGLKSHKMNTLINTCANMMGLQFGCDKCVKIHIGKNHHTDICGKGKVDAWIDEVGKSPGGKET